MTTAALEHLDDGRSFMLMIESASIDKQSHLRRPCGQIGELAQLDATLALLLDYQRKHPETLVLVTADHSQAAQLIPERSVLAGAASPGRFARVRTLEGRSWASTTPPTTRPCRKITAAPKCHCWRAVRASTICRR
jgi:alkaline phosphatase